jgi:hypothetical protein
LASRKTMRSITSVINALQNRNVLCCGCVGVANWRFYNRNLEQIKKQASITQIKVWNQYTLIFSLSFLDNFKFSNWAVTFLEYSSTPISITLSYITSYKWYRLCLWNGHIKYQVRMNHDRFRIVWEFDWLLCCWDLELALLEK